MRFTKDTIPHEEEKEEEEEKLATTNTQCIHIHYAIRDAFPKNKRPLIITSEDASPSLQCEVSARVRNEEVRQRSNREKG
jgi:hypothetical protein